MCILFIAFKQRSDYPLIIAANRDEFYSRPTQQSHIWHEAPTIYAGRDLRAGGSWMGVTRRGKIAALTNIRHPQSTRGDVRSRGERVTHFLTSNANQTDYENELIETADRYNGYNLVYGTWQQLHIFNNRDKSSQVLVPGVHGLSNASLNVPWPKVNKGIAELTDYCKQQPVVDPAALFHLLNDDTQAEDEALPDTGIDYQWEKTLSSIFIQSESYGTRSSTVLLVKANGQATWCERTFSSSGNPLSDRLACFQFSFIDIGQ